MKLQKSESRQYKGKTYVKYTVTIPKDDFRRLKWSDNQELKGIVADDMYILKPKE